jgi:hypothetical protein
MPKKRKSKSSHYSPDRRVAKPPPTALIEHSPAEGNDPDALGASATRQLPLGFTTKNDPNDHYEKPKNSAPIKISTYYPALKRSIETENLDLDDPPWHHLVEHSITLLRAASELLGHFNAESNFSSDVDAVVKHLLSINTCSANGRLKERTFNDTAAQTSDEPTADASTQTIAAQTDRARATRSSTRSYAEVAAAATPVPLANRVQLEAQNSTPRKQRPATHPKNSLPTKRFTLQMETPVEEEGFNPVALRDHFNTCLPYPEVVGVARSRQGNLVVTCRHSAAAALKHQHRWLSGLPPVKQVNDEERWARRVLYLRGPFPTDTSLSNIEREVRDFNSAKLAASPRCITEATIILFFRSEKEAPRELYLFGTHVRLAKYKPKPRRQRVRFETESSTDMEMY